MSEDIVDVETKTCFHCGKGGKVRMPMKAYEAWKRGAFIQAAWPQGSAGEREQLISGLHGPCFDAEFPPDEDDLEGL